MELENPAVSALIPTRNRPDLVVRAVSSALRQNFKALEVIVVVDGPDQTTVQALAEFRDPRLRVIALQKSVGGAEARNVAARACSGQWVALLDDDDEWLPEKIERQVTAAQSGNPDRVLVVSKFVERSSARNDVVRPRRLPLPGERICEYMFDFLCYFQTSTFFCSRELFLELPFRKELKSFQDIDWFLRVNSDPTVDLQVVAEPLSVYYSPDQRASITGGLGWRDRLAWGQRNRMLMTRRAYSRFIAGSCAGTAVRDHAGPRALGRLLVECVLHGAPTPLTIALLFAAFLVKPNTRRRLRDRFFLSSPEADASRAELESRAA